MVVGMESAGSVFKGGRLLQLLSGQMSGRKLVWVRQALICLSQATQDLPLLQTVTAKVCLLSWGHGHPGHPQIVYQNYFLW